MLSNVWLSLFAPRKIVLAKGLRIKSSFYCTYPGGGSLTACGVDLCYLLVYQGERVVAPIVFSMVERVLGVLGVDKVLGLAG